MKCDTSYDVVVIGGGPAGMAAALRAREAGSRVIILERNDRLGGILPQCIHNGFGAIIFGRDLPGPEYAARYRKLVADADITVMTDTMVLDLSSERDIYAMNPEAGYLHFKPRSVVLAMGCRERTRAQIRLPGSRAAGVYSAGTVQRLINIEGYMPGRRFVILGSGDIGMIMARRLTIEGADVVGVYELLPYLTGLRRNYVQCLEDYHIPLHLSTTVTNVIGDKRVEAVEVSKVDENLKAIPGTTERIACDSLLLSVGLIPENELSRAAGIAIDIRTGGPIVDESMATNVPGIFAAGNVTAIYDLVDYVTKAGEVAGASASAFANAAFATGDRNRAAAHGTSAAGFAVASASPAAADDRPMHRFVAGANVGTVLPQRVGELDGAAGAASPGGGVERYLSIRPRKLLETRVRVSLREKPAPACGNPNAAAGVNSRVSGDGHAGGDGREIYRFVERYARPAEMILRRMDERMAAAIASATTEEIEICIDAVQEGQKP